MSSGAGDPLAGVAIWAPPGIADVDQDLGGDLARDAIATMGVEAEARLDSFVSEQRVYRDRDIGPSTWYLDWLAVDPEHQRAGVAAAAQ